MAQVIVVQASAAQEAGNKVDNLNLNHISQEVFDAALNLINSGRASEAKALLDSAQPVSAAQKRQKQHLLGFALQRLDQPKQALSVLIAAHREFGPHVSLLADIYQTSLLCDEALQARRYMLILKAELDKCFEFLSPLQKFRSLLSLGKAHEDSAYLAMALTCFERALSLAVTDLQTAQALAQIIRIKAMYGVSKGLGEAYRSLLVLQTVNTNLQNEITHALCLAESLLIDAHTGWLRLQGMLNHPASTMADKRLTLFDLAETLLRQSATMSAANLTLLQKLTTEAINATGLDAFETVVLCFMQENDSQISEQMWLELPQKMDTACYLRLLHLRLMRAANASTRQEIKQKLMLLTEGLDTKTQEIWSGYLPELNESGALVLLLDLQLYKLEFNAKSIDFRGKQTSFQVLHMLWQSNAVTLEQATQRLWQSEPDLASYDRLRVLISRLNKSIYDITGEPKLIEFGAKGLCLKSKVFLDVRGCSV